MTMQLYTIIIKIPLYDTYFLTIKNVMDFINIGKLYKKIQINSAKITIRGTIL